MSSAPTFRPAALDFLRGLARENGKPWFEARRDAYERDVRAPLLELVGVEAGGALYRIIVDSDDDFLYPASHFREV